MRSKPTWKMFKEYLHNELQISKELIREWVKEAVQDEARKIVENHFGKFTPEEIIHRTILKHDRYGAYLDPEIKRMIASEFNKHIEKELSKISIHFNESEEKEI